ncbi:MAG: hypothetical protein JXA91_08615 [Candidatus Thermoplasmatota archaeon]|nr:hypothetical protein [Candidatus Thermoplasmatota archaeon]
MTDDYDKTLKDLYRLILVNITKNLDEHKLSFNEALQILDAVKDDLIVSHLSFLDKRVYSLEKHSEEKVSDGIDRAIN